MPRRWSWGKPEGWESDTMKNWEPVICVEIVNYCNARCPYCPTGNGKLKSRAQMNPEIFEAIIRHLLNIGVLSEKNSLVLLFNYGEPFLHPEINRILEILRKNNLKAGFSSNFIKYPDISPAYFEVIGTVILSLSGMTDRTYGAIHGGDIERVLANFERFLDRLNAANPEAIVYASWHRYRINEDELESAGNYFKRKKVVFRPCLAYLIDLEKNIEVIEAGGIASEEGKKLNRQLFLDRVYGVMNSLSGTADPRNFECPQFNILAINEYGELLTCCGLTRYHEDYTIGNVLEMNAGEIYRTKRSAPICRKCLTHGIPQYMQKDINELQRLLNENRW